MKTFYKVFPILFLTLVCSYFAFAQKVGALWVDYTTSAVNPVTAGKSGTYFNSVDKTQHSVDNTGLDKTTVDTMQTAYTNQPASPANVITETAANLGPVYKGYTGQTAPLMTYRLDGIGGTYAGPLVLENQTLATLGTPMEQPPSLLFKGNTYDFVGTGASRPDWARLTVNTLDGGNNTFYFDLDHSQNGTTFGNVLRVVAQEEIPTLEESILATAAYPNMCWGPTYPAGGLGFFCVNGNVLKFGPSLGSTQRMELGPAGLLPSFNNQVDLGNIFSNQFKSVGAGIVAGHKDAIGTANPDDNYGLWLSNLSAASSGSQQFSPAARMQGYSWNDAAMSYVVTDIFVRQEGVQVTGAPPSNQMAVYSSVAGSVSNQLLSTTRNIGGGTFEAQHLSGHGTAPTFTPTAAITCAGGGSVTATTGSSDTAGTIIITTGAAPCTVVFGALTVSFNQAYRQIPTVVVSNANPNAATANLYHHQPADSTSDFQINTVSTLTPATEYRLSYIVVANNDNN